MQPLHGPAELHPPSSSSPPPYALLKPTGPQCTQCSQNHGTCLLGLMSYLSQNLQVQPGRQTRAPQPTTRHVSGATLDCAAGRPPTGLPQTSAQAQGQLVHPHQTAHGGLSYMTTMCKHHNTSGWAVCYTAEADRCTFPGRERSAALGGTTSSWPMAHLNLNRPLCLEIMSQPRCSALIQEDKARLRFSPTMPSLS